MTFTLVTGAAAPAPGLEAALRSEGSHVVYAPGWACLNRKALDLFAGSVDCYVQLPSGTPTAPDPVHHVVLADMLARLDALEEVAPLLAPGARVVLVPDAGQAPYTMMLRSLIDTFARVILDINAGPAVRITLMPAHPSPDDIAVAAHETARAHPSQSLADLDPGRPFTCWRDDAMLLWSLDDRSGARQSE